LEGSVLRLRLVAAERCFNKRFVYVDASVERTEGAMSGELTVFAYTSKSSE
jgi:hypothetical protein